MTTRFADSEPGAGGAGAAGWCSSCADLDWVVSESWLKLFLSHDHCKSSHSRASVTGPRVVTLCGMPPRCLRVRRIPGRPLTARLECFGPRAKQCRTWSVALKWNPKTYETLNVRFSDGSRYWVVWRFSDGNTYRVACRCSSNSDLEVIFWVVRIHSAGKIISSNDNWWFLSDQIGWSW